MLGETKITDFSPILKRIQTTFNMGSVSKREINDYFKTSDYSKNQFIADNVYGYALSKQIPSKIDKLNSPSQYEEVEEELQEADSLASESDFRSELEKAETSFEERKRNITESLKFARSEREEEKREAFRERALEKSREDILQGSKVTIKSFSDFYGLEENDTINLIESRGLFIRDGRIVEEI